MVETKTASIQSKSCLALLLSLFCLSGFAAEPTAQIQTLQWHGDLPSPPTESVTVSEERPDDVWQRIRNGFKIDEAAADNPLVATYVAWYAARPDYVPPPKPRPARRRKRSSGFKTTPAFRSY